MLKNLNKTPWPWLGGKADAAPLDTDALWARALLLLVLGETNLSRPGVYPTPEGNLRAEWATESLDVALVFELSKHQVTVETCRFEDDEQQEREFPARYPELLLQHLEAFVQELRDGDAEFERDQTSERTRGAQAGSRGCGEVPTARPRDGAGVVGKR